MTHAKHTAQHARSLGLARLLYIHTMCNEGCLQVSMDTLSAQYQGSNCSGHASQCFMFWGTRSPGLASRSSHAHFARMKLQQNGTATPLRRKRNTQSQTAQAFATFLQMVSFAQGNSNTDLPPTADTHIYICMLACTMHVWLAKQPPSNRGLRQWLPSCVHNSSHRFSLSLSLSCLLYTSPSPRDS